MLTDNMVYIYCTIASLTCVIFGSYLIRTAELKTDIRVGLIFFFFGMTLYPAAVIFPFLVFFGLDKLVSFISKKK